MIQGLDCDEKIKELRETAWSLQGELTLARELNAELLQDLIEVLPYAKSWAGWDDAVVRNAEKTIAMAKEKLK